MATFIEVQFPCGVSIGSTAGPERRTEVVTLGSGFEERNSKWANSRRVYNAGYGVKTLDDIHEVIAFFEMARGKLYGFRWKDYTDFKSCLPSVGITAFDQNIGVGDGVTKTFQLRKRYGSGSLPWYRDIKKPVPGTVKVSVGGTVLLQPTGYVLSLTSGLITMSVAPAIGTNVMAGFEFDVPVRFDIDMLELSVTGIKHGDIPSIKIVEIRI
jgi:uncharacterized protein (TIGR02217 family)